MNTYLCLADIFAETKYAPYDDDTKKYLCNFFSTGIQGKSFYHTSAKNAYSKWFSLRYTDFGFWKSFTLAYEITNLYKYNHKNIKNSLPTQKIRLLHTSTKNNTRRKVTEWKFSSQLRTNFRKNKLTWVYRRRCPSYWYLGKLAIFVPHERSQQYAFDWDCKKKYMGTCSDNM